MSDALVIREFTACAPVNSRFPLVLMNRGDRDCSSIPSGRQL